MRILYIATSFPSPDKGATIYTDLASALHEAGHEILVAVSEQKRNLTATTLQNERGFDVLRIVTGNYYDVNLIEKGLTMLRIPSRMKKGIKEHLSNKSFDLILFEAPPITNAKLVAWAKKQFKTKSYLMLKDIFPQNAVDLGMMRKNGLLYTYFHHQEKFLYQTADKIGVMSQANLDYILKHNPQLDPSKFEIFPNTKQITQDYQTQEFTMRKELNIPANACVFLFGGNMGRPQYVQLLKKAILRFKDNPNIFFLFVGRGTDRHILETAIKDNEIKNALLINNLARDKYEQITKECDVGLIILDPRFTIPNYPSRILSYMEYAKPVLAATDENTDLKDLIQANNLGEWVSSANEMEFFKKIEEMSKSDSLIFQGQNGRRLIEQEFTVNRSVKQLEAFK